VSCDTSYVAVFITLLRVETVVQNFNVIHFGC
jgi:hypothetical protein